MLKVDFIVDKKFGVPEEWFGKYVVRQLMAIEAEKVGEQMLAKQADAELRPETIDIKELHRRIAEKATTRNGKPFALDLNKMPAKLWTAIKVANTKLNLVTDDEAHFLSTLLPAENRQPTQPSSTTS